MANKKASQGMSDSRNHQTSAHVSEVDARKKCDDYRESCISRESAIDAVAAKIEEIVEKTDEQAKEAAQYFLRGEPLPDYSSAELAFARDYRADG
jgi:hypothetical protein